VGCVFAPLIYFPSGAFSEIISQCYSQLTVILKNNKQKAWKFVCKLPIFAPLRKGGTVASREGTLKKEGFKSA